MVSTEVGSAGGGEFQVTTGLLHEANDVQLAGVLAHERAHDDLGQATSDRIEALRSVR
jgi:Peptidase family M48